MDPGGSSVEPARRPLGHFAIAAVAFAILADLAIYSVMGDSDLFLALATGAAVVTWLVLWVERRFSRRATP
jgi:hypothetical protein